MVSPRRPLQQRRVLPAPPELEAPPDWPGSLPEWLVFEELEQRGYVGSGGRLGEPEPEVADFVYQDPQVGGRHELGGIIVDFLFYRPPGLAFSVIGVYFHYIHEGGTKARDILARDILASRGYRLIFLEDTAVLSDVSSIVGLALQGIDRSQFA